ncbi:DUF1376 domain-containing protein [Bartonella sp. WD12.1]|uniref:DUF1376 domain-containing protein n=1 Tax=Bartonella sp. WD12.1 TaxID=1933903 RepID=UPI0009C9864C|nr:DUF1376 domain-containing protein [Bartonella sp. WD12.1]OPB29811.1 Protein of unknown function (DUF1376) [Bartonella sp. WD12.1]
MSTKLLWTRLFADKWILDLTYLSPIESNVYIRLQLEMLRTGEPLLNNMKVLACHTNCSVKTFVKALDALLSAGYIIRLEDGRLWKLDVEEELKNCNDNLNRLSEKAIKAANTRRNKRQNNSSRDHDEIMMESSQNHDDIMMNSSRGHDEVMMMSSRQHINNNIYNKKLTLSCYQKKKLLWKI